MRDLEMKNDDNDDIITIDLVNPPHKLVLVNELPEIDIMMPDVTASKDPVPQAKPGFNYLDFFSRIENKNYKDHDNYRRIKWLNMQTGQIEEKYVLKATYKNLQFKFSNILNKISYRNAFWTWKNKLYIDAMIECDGQIEKCKLLTAAQQKNAKKSVANKDKAADLIRGSFGASYICSDYGM